LCMAAMRENGYALRYAKSQTPELVLAARQSIVRVHRNVHAAMIDALRIRVSGDVALLVMGFAAGVPFVV